MMKFPKVVVSRVVFAVLFCLQLYADQITLKNGDRLTGTIQKSDEKQLLLQTEYAGTVSVQWEAVTAISSLHEMVLTLRDGQTLRGAVSTTQEKFQVQTREGGVLAISKEAVASIRSSEEEKAYQAEIDRLRNPRLLDLWSGFLDTGLSLARGNAETSSFNLGMNAARTTKRDKIGVYVTSLYSKSRTLGKSQLLANAIRGGIRYDFNLSDRSFAFGLTDLEFDEFQKLDLRFAGGGGLGWHAVKTERTLFDLFGGGDLNKEFFSTGLKRTSGEVLVGNELMHKLSNVTSLRERFVFFPNVSELGQHRVTFDVSALASLKKWFGWQITLSDRYLSNPLPGTKKNDVLLTTGIRLTFAR